MKTHVTIDDIARLAGVNRSTVSRALNPASAGMISKAQREKIIAICDEHLYRPRSAAQALARGKTSAIALVLGDMPRDFLSPVFAEFITGLSDAVQKYGYSLMVLRLDCRFSQYEEQLRHILLSEQADGYVMGASLVTEKIADLIQSLKIPVVSLVQYSGTRAHIPAVVGRDDQAVAELLQRIPTEFEGKCLYTAACCTENEYKKNTIRRQLKLMGRSEEFFSYLEYAPPHRGVHMGRYNGRCLAMEQWDYFRKFRLIWCAADLNAQGIGDVFSEHGLVPGKDIFLAGFDNIEGIFRTPEPSLTTIDSCPEEMGRQTADYIFAGMKNPAVFAVNLQVEARLIMRGSFPGCVGVHSDTYVKEKDDSYL